MSDSLEIARQWVAKAQNDLLNADNNLQAEHIPFDTVCFHCQQAAEKLLKAFLVCHEQIPPHTHDILALLQRILPFNRDVEKLRENLTLLMPYAVEIRYPDDWFVPSSSDANEARDAAEHVRIWLKENLPELFQKVAVEDLVLPILNTPNP